VHVTHVTMPEETRITWRRHLPAWIGFVYHTSGRRRWICGVYLRLGDRAHLLDAAEIVRLPVPVKRG